MHTSNLSQFHRFFAKKTKPRDKPRFPQKRTLFILVPIFSEFLLAFMGCNLSEFALSSAGHLNPSFLLISRELNLV
jgi:hypothetical protein